MMKIQIDDNFYSFLSTLNTELVSIQKNFFSLYTIGTRKRKTQKGNEFGILVFYYQNESLW